MQEGPKNSTIDILSVWFGNNEKKIIFHVTRVPKRNEVTFNDIEGINGLRAMQILFGQFLKSKCN